MDRILIVDDETKVFLEPTVRFLKNRKKYKIETASSSEEALKIIRKRKIDVLVVDYLLFDDPLNGDDIIRIVRDEERVNNYVNYLPCILTTGSEGKKAIKHKLLDLKINFHDKLDGIAVLMNKIDECLEEVKARRKGGKMKLGEFKQYIIYPLIVGLLIAIFAFVLRSHESKSNGLNSSGQVSDQNTTMNIVMSVFSRGGGAVKDAYIVLDRMPSGVYTDMNGYARIQISSNLQGQEGFVRITKNGYVPVKKTITFQPQTLEIILERAK